MKDTKKGRFAIIIIICSLIGLSIALFLGSNQRIKEKQLEIAEERFSEEKEEKQTADKETEEEGSITEEAWSADSLKKGIVTAIEYDTQYNAHISSKEGARQAIKEYGIRQRGQYSNSAVEEIELQMEQDFGILAVNLGEMDKETAKDVQNAFTYMYQTYPVLQDSLTNISLGNFKSSDAGKIAVTQCREFIINEEYGVCPFVVKHEIILSAAKFIKRENLLKTCEEMEETGHWPPNMNITAIVVHELGHQLLDVYAKEQCGLQDEYYITEENQEAYSKYVTDLLSTNQTIPQKVLNRAFHNWEAYHPGSDYQAFCESISLYAVGKQEDGGISYPETFAEAIADVYLNGENAADASKEIQKIALEFSK